MTKETVLVVGLGEIGCALFELLREEDSFTVYGLDLDKTKMRATSQDSSKLPRKMDTRTGRLRGFWIGCGYTRKRKVLTTMTKVNHKRQLRDEVRRLRAGAAEVPMARAARGGLRSCRLTSAKFAEKSNEATGGGSCCCCRENKIPLHGTLCPQANRVESFKFKKNKR